MVLVVKVPPANLLNMLEMGENWFGFCPIRSPVLVIMQFKPWCAYVLRTYDKWSCIFHGFFVLVLNCTG